MSEFNEENSPAGVAAEVHIPPVGPLESRRSRRERSEAAAASLSHAIPTPGHDSFESHPPQTTVVFSDELAVARRQRLLAIAQTERQPALHEDWSS